MSRTLISVLTRLAGLTAVIGLISAACAAAAPAELRPQPSPLPAAATPTPAAFGSTATATLSPQLDPSTPSDGITLVAFNFRNGESVHFYPTGLSQEFSFEVENGKIRVGVYGDSPEKVDGGPLLEGGQISMSNGVQFQYLGGEVSAVFFVPQDATAWVCPARGEYQPVQVGQAIEFPALGFTTTFTLVAVNENGRMTFETQLLDQNQQFLAGGTITDTPPGFYRGLTIESGSNQPYAAIRYIACGGQYYYFLWVVSSGPQG